MDILIVVVAVSAAVGFAGWKAWGLFKPGAKGCGCGCGTNRSSSCSGCPIVKP